MHSKKRTTKRILKGVAAAILTAGIAGAGYKIYQKNKKSTKPVDKLQTVEPTEIKQIVTDLEDKLQSAEPAEIKQIVTDLEDKLNKTDKGESLLGGADSVKDFIDVAKRISLTSSEPSLPEPALKELKNTANYYNNLKNSTSIKTEKNNELKNRYRKKIKSKCESLWDKEELSIVEQRNLLEEMTSLIFNALVEEEYNKRSFVTKRYKPYDNPSEVIEEHYLHKMECIKKPSIRWK